MNRDESKFTRGAWLTLAFVSLLFFWGTVGMLYFFTLPTDGWFGIPQEVLDENLVAYKQDVLGVPSALQPGDLIVAIDDIPAAKQDFSAMEDRWTVGATMHYTVQRNGVQLEVSVPLAAWQFGPALNYWVLQYGGVLGLLGMLLFFVIAALTFFKRPNDHAARALFVFASLFLALSPFISTGQASPPMLVFPPIGLMVTITIFAAYSVLYPPVLIWFAMVFPHPKPIVRRFPYLEYWPFLVGLAIIPFFLLEIFIAGYLWTIFSIVAAIVILIHSAFTMRDALSRAQLLWGLWGFVLGMAMFLTTYLDVFGLVSGVWADVANSLTLLSFSVLGVTLGIAILRYRLFDIGVIIRRTVTYALVVALLVVIYFGGVILLQQLFASVTGERSEVITVVSTLAIAVLFIPLRNFVQNAIDKRFNRRKYDAQQVLTKFAQTVRDETDLDKLTSEMLNVVNETMQPKRASVWLKPTGNRRRMQ